MKTGIITFFATAGLFYHIDVGLAQTRIQSYLLSKPSTKDQNQVSVVFDEEPAEKSVTLAVIYSLILPGMGELYAGTFATGKYFLIGDTGIWLTYAGFVSHGNWLRKDARSFAAQHAQAQLAGKDQDFEVNIGNFGNLTEYNEQKLRNREYDRMYSSPGYFWQWDSDENRILFRSLRIRSDETFRNARFLIGAAVVNRIASAFLAGRAAAAHNRRVRYEGAWRLRVYPSGGLLSAHGVALEVSKEF